MNVATTWNLISDSDRTDDSVFLIDLQNLTFRYVNNRACQKLGYSRDELLQMGILDIDPLMDEASLQKITDQIQTQGFYLLETCHRTKDGCLFPVEVNGHILEYNGELVGISIARDITERKQKDNQLALLDYAFEHVGEAIFLVDDNAHFFHVNEKACTSLGYTREELLTMRIFDIDPNFTPEHWEQLRRSVVDKTLSVTLETYHKTKDGRIFPVEVSANYISYQGKSYDMAIVRDISERKETEQQLTLLNHALDHVKEVVWLIDENAKFHYNNAEACRALGYTREELLPLGVPDINPDYQLDVWPEHWQAFKASGSLLFESRNRTKDGHIFPVEINANYFEFNGESYNLAFVRDISERKATEKQLTLLNYALDRVGEATWLIDEDANLNYVNQEACASLGYSLDELLQLNLTNVGAAFSIEDWHEHWKELKAKKNLRFETNHKTKDGRVFPVEVNANYFKFDGKDYNLALSHDITERKATEKQLVLLNYALDHVGEAAWLIDENAKFHYNNAQACRTIGYSHEEMLQLCVPDIDPNYQMDIWPEHWQDLKTNGSLTFESLHKTKDGRIFPVEINANYFEFDGTGYNLALIRNITERKQAQEALQRSESLLSEAQRIAHIGSWEVDFANGELLWTEENYRIWEIDKSQFGATVEAFYETVHPEDLEKVANAYNESVANKTLYQIEHRLLFPDGRVKYIAERGEPFFDEKGDIIRFVGTSMDITEQQYVKDTLEFIAQRGWKDKNESFLVALAQYLSQILGIDYVIIAKLGTPVTQAESIVFYAKGEMQPNIQYDLEVSPCGNVMNGKLCCYSENIQQLFPDDVFFVEMQIESYAGIPLSDTTGKVIGLIALMGSKPLNDTVFVTSILQLVATSVAAELERQRSEQVLLNSHHFLKQIVNTLADPVFVKDRQHRWILLNQAFCDYVGYPLEELLGKSDYDIHLPHEANVYWEKDELVFSTGEENINEETSTTADGYIRTILTKKTRYTDSNGQQFLVGIITDITERKKMEDELAAREQQFRVLAETLPSPVFRFDKECRYIYMNPIAEKISGITAEELLYKKASDSSPLNEEELKKVEQTIQHVLKTGEPQEGDVLFKVPSTGQVYYFQNSYAPEFDTSGNVESVIVISHDITERKKMEEKLRQREQEFRVLVETSPTPIARYDKNLRRIYVNPAVEKITGKTAAELLGDVPSSGSIVNKHDGEIIEQILQHVLTTGQTAENELKCILADGQLHYFSSRYAAELDVDGNPTGVVLISHDITERKQMEEIVRQREQDFRILVETSPSPIIRYDANCRRVYVNPAVEKMSGKTSAELLARLPTEGTLLSEPVKNETERILQHVLKTGQPTENEAELVLADGQIHYFHNRYAPELDVNGKVVGVVLIGHDVTERKRIEQEMHYHASYDSLTGLPNRRMLNHRMYEEITKATRGNYGLAVFFIDLDRFKEVNDTLGHEIGDCLLVEAANRIHSCIRTSDTVARLGGDEFVVILSCVGKIPPLERVAQSIVVELSKPFFFGFEYSAYISASVGVAVYPQDASDAEMLISCADQAMYAAKESGRNSFNFFTQSMQDQAQQRLRLIGSLREALEKNQFEVYYQPITDVVSGKAVKAEALVRWHHPVLGMVSPAIFIPLAEETDLIQDIGSWVFRQAADTSKRWNALNEDDEHRLISINMSPRQLTKGTGDQIAIDYLQEIELDSSHVVIEITEGLLLDDSPTIIEKLDRLRLAGIQLSLDDFGTGYSAMSYLKKFNLDYLKIDQSFVRGMETEAGDQAITEAIIMMAHRLGLKVIAEGVETEGQRKLLAEAGCEYIQGYFYSKPLPIDAFLSYVLQ